MNKSMKYYFVKSVPDINSSTEANVRNYLNRKILRSLLDNTDPLLVKHKSFKCKNVVSLFVGAIGDIIFLVSPCRRL